MNFTKMLPGSTDRNHADRDAVFSRRPAWLAAILFPVFAILAAFTPVVHAEDGQAAQQLVEQAVTNVMAELKAKKGELASNPKVLDGTIAENIIPHLDFVAMTRLSVGKSWRKADDAQQKTLVEEFRTFLLNTYRSALSEYGGEEIDFLPYKKNKRDDRAVVDSVFKYESNEVPVTYKLHNKAGPWQVYDIVVSDLSLVLQYKSSFSSEIERNGIDGLIKLLKDKNNT